jgi:hypothetical protein
MPRRTSGRTMDEPEQEVLPCLFTPQSLREPRPTARRRSAPARSRRSRCLLSRGRGLLRADHRLRPAAHACPGRHRSRARGGQLLRSPPREAAARGRRARIRHSRRAHLAEWPRQRAARGRGPKRDRERHGTGRGVLAAASTVTAALVQGSAAVRFADLGAGGTRTAWTMVLLSLGGTLLGLMLVIAATAVVSLRTRLFARWFTVASGRARAALADRRLHHRLWL